MEGHLTFNTISFGDGSIEFNITSGTGDITVELSTESQVVAVEPGASFKIHLGDSETARIICDGTTVYEMTSLEGVDVQSKVMTVDAAKNRYIRGETWILELENELAEILN